MRNSINGVANLEALKTSCKAFIEDLLTAADASGDPKGFVVDAVQSEQTGGVLDFPFTNDEIMELYLEVLPEPAPVENPFE